VDAPCVLYFGEGSHSRAFGSGEVLDSRAPPSPEIVGRP